MKSRIIFVFIITLAVILRFTQLGGNPPGLYWDEASLGYNAYSILKTGKDEHGEFLPIARFTAFGDYKPPGYIYAAVPFMAIFGLSDFSVRAPSALAGVLMVLVTFFLVKELLENEAPRANSSTVLSSLSKDARGIFSSFGGAKSAEAEDRHSSTASRPWSSAKEDEEETDLGKRWNRDATATLAALFLAISPWSIMLSRAAFEANLAALFNLLGVYFLIKTRKNAKFLFLSSLFFILSFYTFNANRIIAPLLFSGLLLIILGRKLLSFKKEIFISFLIWIVLLLPSFQYLKGQESKIRLQEVSIFNNLEPLKVANLRIAVDKNSLWARIAHNRRLSYLKEYLDGYFKNFSGRFLFTNGDRNPRFSTGEIGNLYLFDLPFLLLGTYFLFKKRKEAALPIFFWMLVIPVPAAFAKEVPHALRIISILPTYQILTAYGFISFLNFFKKKKTFIFWGAVFGIIFLFNIFYFFHNYFIHYPSWSFKEWQYGYKELVKEVSRMENDYEKVVITESVDRPYIYFLFYREYDPRKYWQEREARSDIFGFWEISGFGKYKFGLNYLGNQRGQKTLVVLGPNEDVEGFKEVKEISGLDKKTVFKIGEVR